MKAADLAALPTDGAVNAHGLEAQVVQIQVQQVQHLCHLRPYPCCVRRSTTRRAPRVNWASPVFCKTPAMADREWPGGLQGGILCETGL